MTRINRSTADTDYARELRAEGLAQLRAALFQDADQAALFTDRETIALAKLHYKQKSFLTVALEHADWPGVTAAADFLGALQEGLQKLDIADSRA